jgi:hypothetical protein
MSECGPGENQVCAGKIFDGRPRLVNMCPIHEAEELETRRRLSGIADIQVSFASMKEVVSFNTLIEELSVRAQQGKSTLIKVIP